MNICARLTVESFVREKSMLIRHFNLNGEKSKKSLEMFLTNLTRIGYYLHLLDLSRT